MRRVIALLAAAAVMTTTMAATAAADPVATCPAAASGFVMVDRDAWVERTLEGLSLWVDVSDPAALDAFVQQFGFPDWDTLEAFIRTEQWSLIDLNEDDYVCMKAGPNSPGLPSYLFNGLDNRAHVPG